MVCVFEFVLYTCLNLILLEKKLLQDRINYLLIVMKQKCPDTLLDLVVVFVS